MKSYLLKLNGREEGPYAEAHIAQMFADQHVSRSTPCKPEIGGDWRTIDDYLPTLKYGTQLPVPTSQPASANRTASATHTSTTMQPVFIRDVDVPFMSVLKMAFKIAVAWLIVSVCFVPVVLI